MGASTWLPGFMQGAGNAIGGYLGYLGQEDANKMNWQIAQAANAQQYKMFRENMSWQERMSSTAYQRARADMLAAGINPILAATQGGASSPGGSTPSPTTGAPMQNALSSLGSGISSAVNSAVDVYKKVQEVKNLTSANEQIQTQSALNNAIRNTQVNSAAKIAVDTQKAKNELPKSSVKGKAWTVIDKLTSNSARNLDRSIQQANDYANSNKNFHGQVDDFVHRILLKGQTDRLIRKHGR